jgi:16S rRNA (cytosine967-C5)-methyltransferase
LSKRPARSNERPVPEKTLPRTGKTLPALPGLAKISPARSAAFEILLRVAGSDAHSDDLLHSPLIAGLSQEDRNLSTALVMGVLRWQIALDAQIAKHLARPGQQLAEPVAIALRMGAFQLRHMDRIPAHAAINESVELCRAAGQAHAAGMVNAVLRKLTAEAEAVTIRGNDSGKRRTPIFESPVALAQRLGHPAWLVERWIAEYGRKPALAICEYNQHEPTTGSLFAKTTAGNEGNTSLPVAAAAQMDDGSRLVAELATAALPDTDGKAVRIWDCCAAPGGKTVVIAERLAGAKILATDVSPRRLARMKDRIAASPFADRVDCEVMDAARPHLAAGWGANAAFDLILCDAPCSGTGTLARNPEIRFRLRPEDLARQAARQQTILCSALGQLVPGGRLLYSTCSLEPEENEQAVEAVLKKQPEIQQVPLGPVLEKLATMGSLSAEVAASLGNTAIRKGCLRTLPGVHPFDGFFAALLERAK